VIQLNEGVTTLKLKYQVVHVSISNRRAVKTVPMELHLSFVILIIFFYFLINNLNIVIKIIK